MFENFLEEKPAKWTISRKMTRLKKNKRTRQKNKRGDRKESNDSPEIPGRKGTAVGRHSRLSLRGIVEKRFT